MAKALKFNGGNFARAATLGNILGSKLGISTDHFVWSGGAGTIFSQCVSQSTSKEFQLFVNNDNLWLSAGGVSNEFASFASIFGGTSVSGALSVVVDFPNETMVIRLDGEVIFSEAITVGSGRVDNAHFRLGARGDSSTTVGTGGGFFAPANSEFGDILVEIDDVPVRRYVSDGEGATWEESVSNSDASIIGGVEWVDYGVAQANSIEIVSPNVTKVFNWNNNTTAAVAFSVTFTGSPSALQRSVDGGQTWQTASSSPTSPFNETLSLSAGMYDIVYRFSNATAVSDSIVIGVGPVIVPIGHSNIMQLGDNNQALQPSVNGVNAYMYGLDGNWKVAQDPLHSPSGSQYSVLSDSSAGGTSWMLFANQWLADNPDIPIAFIPCAKGGTQATDWTYSTSTSTCYGAMRARIAAASNDNVDSFMCGFGGNEARFDVSYSQLQSTMESIANSLQAAYDAPMYFMPLQNYTTSNRPVGDGRTNGKVAMSSAVLDFVASRNDCFVWASIFATDLDVGPNADGVHFKTDSQLSDLFNASYSSYVRGDTQCQINTPDAADGIYTLTLTGEGYSVEYPVYVESGVANTSGFELEQGTAVSGQITNGTSTFLLNGVVGGALEADAPNQAPTANAGPDQSVAAGVLVQVSASASSDGDGTIVGYKWRETTNSGITLSSTTAESISFTSPVSDTAQTVTLELIVTDDDGVDSAPVYVDFNVEAEVVAPTLETLSIEIKGSGTGSHEVTVFLASDISTPIYSGLATFVNDRMVVESSDFSSGQQVVGLWLGNNYPATGGAFYGVVA